MNLLLDTQVFLRFILDPTKLSASFHTAILEPATSVYLSPVSFWEIAVKHQLGKLPFAKDPALLILEARQRRTFIPSRWKRAPSSTWPACQ